jgi:hypothetical protein
MAGRGPAPKPLRYRRADPARGDWKPSPESGWQHDLPSPPGGLRESSLAVWQTWFRSWWAGHWTPDDLPGLRLLIYLYDRVSRGDMRRLGELRQLMDSYGITPKGQQDRRWLRPEPPREQRFAGANPYAHLRAVDAPSAKERFRHLMGDADGADGRQSRSDPRKVLRSHPDPRRKE